MKLALFHQLIVVGMVWMLVSFDGLPPAHAASTDNVSTDCLAALFQQANVRPSHVQRYVQRFRNNGLGPDVLYDLPFLDIVKFLQSKSLNITRAGDVFRLHTCLSGRGNCVLHPFCQNSAACVYNDISRWHVCKCPAHYEGARCETRVPDRLGKVEEALGTLQFSVAYIGVTYTRWGKKGCNASTGSSRVYDGYIAGKFYDHTGGAANHLCLPRHPQYGEYLSGQNGHGYIYGAELETSGFFSPYGDLSDQNPLCAVCHVRGRASQIMIPAQRSCPPCWTTEYSGYVMSASYTSKGRTEYLCVDGVPDVARGGSPNTGGVLLYMVVVDCGYGLPCPPYTEEKELPCVVCTR